MLSSCWYDNTVLQIIRVFYMPWILNPVNKPMMLPSERHIVYTSSVFTLVRWKQAISFGYGPLDIILRLLKYFIYLQKVGFIWKHL